MRLSVHVLAARSESTEADKSGQQLEREALGLVPRHSVGCHLGFGELANGLAEKALLVGGPQVHRVGPL